MSSPKRFSLKEYLSSRQGQIMVTPMKELIKMAHGEKEGE